MQQEALAGCDAACVKQSASYNAFVETFALITGASSGIGKACAEVLAEKKKNLILIARREEKLVELKQYLESSYGISVRTATVDVNNHPAVQTLFSDLQDVSIDVLINNAGLALGKDGFQDASWEDIEAMMHTNTIAFAHFAKCALPSIIKAKGHIINISSIAGIESYAGGATYCATKAFVKAMSKGLRLDLQGTGVRVTDIAPGAVETEFSNVRFKGDAGKASSVYKGFVPLCAKDIAECIAFALSRPASVNIEYMLVMPTAQAGATSFALSE